MAVKHWILKGETPVEVPLKEWGRWFQENDKSLGKTLIGKVAVSTVFLGLDSSFGMAKVPLLFETMVFNKDGEVGDLIYHSTYQEALDGHMKICDELAGVGRLKSFGKQEEE